LEHWPTALAHIPKLTEDAQQFVDDEVALQLAERPVRDIEKIEPRHTGTAARFQQHDVADSLWRDGFKDLLKQVTMRINERYSFASLNILTEHAEQQVALACTCCADQPAMPVTRFGWQVEGVYRALTFDFPYECAARWQMRQLAVVASRLAKRGKERSGREEPGQWILGMTTGGEVKDSGGAFVKITGDNLNLLPKHLASDQL